MKKTRIAGIIMLILALIVAFWAKDIQQVSFLAVNLIRTVTCVYVMIMGALLFW